MGPGLEIPGVQTPVLIHDERPIYAVVELDPVHVMNRLGGCQLAAKELPDVVSALLCRILPTRHASEV